MGLKLYAFLLGLYVLCLLFFTLPTIAITALVIVCVVIWAFWAVCFAICETIIGFFVGFVMMAFGK